MSGRRVGDETGGGGEGGGITGRGIIVVINVRHQNCGDVPRGWEPVYLYQQPLRPRLDRGILLLLLRCLLYNFGTR